MKKEHGSGRTDSQAMMGELIARNLLHRPMRTFIGVMAVAVEVALVVLIVGLTSGLLTETAKRIEGIGADIMVQPPAASVFLGFSGSPMPIKIAATAENAKICSICSPGTYCNLIPPVEWRLFTAIDRESFRAVSGGFVFLQGHDMEGPDDLLVDDWAAKAKKIKVGDTYNLLNHDWHVAAIIEHGKGARLSYRSPRCRTWSARTTKPPFFFCDALARNIPKTSSKSFATSCRATPFAR